MIKLAELLLEAIIPPFSQIFADMRKAHAGIVPDIYGVKDHSDEFQRDPAAFYSNQKRRYDEYVRQYKSLNGHPCWRVMFVEKNIDPSSLEPIGTAWSIERWPNDEAIEWATSTLVWHGKNVTDAKNKQTAIYEAKIDVSHIEWLTTLQKRMRMDEMSELESEIVFKKGSRFHVKNVVIIPDETRPNKFHTIQINKFRTL